MNPPRKPLLFAHPQQRYHVDFRCSSAAIAAGLLISPEGSKLLRYGDGVAVVAIVEVMKDFISVTIAELESPSSQCVNTNTDTQCDSNSLQNGIIRVLSSSGTHRNSCSAADECCMQLALGLAIVRCFTFNRDDLKIDDEADAAVDRGLRLGGMSWTVLSSFERLTLLDSCHFLRISPDCPDTLATATLISQMITSHTDELERLWGSLCVKDSCDGNNMDFSDLAQSATRQDCSALEIEICVKYALSKYGMLASVEGHNREFAGSNRLASAASLISDLHQHITMSLTSAAPRIRSLMQSTPGSYASSDADLEVHLCGVICNIDGFENGPGEYFTDRALLNSETRSWTKNIINLVTTDFASLMNPAAALRRCGHVNDDSQATTRHSASLEDCENPERSSGSDDLVHVEHLERPVVWGLSGPEAVLLGARRLWETNAQAHGCVRVVEGCQNFKKICIASQFRRSDDASALDSSYQIRSCSEKFKFSSNQIIRLAEISANCISPESEFSLGFEFPGKESPAMDISEHDALFSGGSNPASDELLLVLSKPIRTAQAAIRRTCSVTNKTAGNGSESSGASPSTHSYSPSLAEDSVCNDSDSAIARMPPPSPRIPVDVYFLVDNQTGEEEGETPMADLQAICCLQLMLPIDCKTVLPSLAVKCDCSGGLFQLSVRQRRESSATIQTTPTPLKDSDVKIAIPPEAQHPEYIPDLFTLCVVACVLLLSFLLGWNLKQIRTIAKTLIDEL